MLFLISLVLAYPRRLPGMFQKLGLATLYMTMHDSLHAPLEATHGLRLAWCGVIGCVVPLIISLVPLPGVRLPLARSTMAGRLQGLEEACIVHVVSAFDALCSGRAYLSGNASIAV